MGLASNHGDILHWLRKYGLTMNDFRAEVAKAMDEGVAAEYIDAGENTEGGEADMSDMILKRGDKGVLVRNLQEALLAKGYFLPKYGADGAFGNETDSAVREFQTISGLTVDGIVGPKTWAALLENGPEDIPDDAPSVDNDALKAEARGLLKRLGAILDNLS
jgi:hypothetical protein